jgi:hypothetical protein
MDTIEHYGVKGMKWGVRRTDAQLSTARGEKRPSADAKKAAAARAKAATKGTESLSNKQLKDLNQRLNLEQQYDRLTYEPKQQSTMAKASTFIASEAGQVLMSAGKQVATQYVANEMRKRIGLS